MSCARFVWEQVPLSFESAPDDKSLPSIIHLLLRIASRWFREAECEVIPLWLYPLEIPAYMFCAEWSFDGLLVHMIS